MVWILSERGILFNVFLTLVQTFRRPSASDIRHPTTNEIESREYHMVALAILSMYVRTEAHRARDHRGH